MPRKRGCRGGSVISASSRQLNASDGTMESEPSILANEVTIMNSFNTSTESRSALSSFARSHRQNILKTMNASLVDKHKHMALQFLNDDSNIKLETIKFSLLCPYSRTRICVPVRSSLCRHIQCVDLDSWVHLIEYSKATRDPVVPCPVCKVRVRVSSLYTDEWILMLLRLIPLETEFIVLEDSGAYYDGNAQHFQKEVTERTEAIIVDAASPLFEDNEKQSNSFTSLREESFYRQVKQEPMQEVDRNPSDIDNNFETETHDSTNNNDDDNDTDIEDTQRFSLSPRASTLIFSEVELESSVPCTHFVSSHAESSEEALEKGMIIPSSISSISTDSTLDPSFLENSMGVSEKAWIHVRSGLRRWLNTCPKCGMAESSNSIPSASFDASLYEAIRLQWKWKRCSCGFGTYLWQWPLIRTFEGPSHSLRMELTADGTLIISGVQRFLASYLMRAGFYMGGCSLWYSSQQCSRIDLDFLEALCVHCAEGKSEPALFFPAPARFRIHFSSGIKKQQKSSTFDVIKPVWE